MNAHVLRLRIEHGPWPGCTCRCPGASALGVAVLADHEVAIGHRGVATIARVARCDHLWRPVAPRPGHEDTLDRVEGVRLGLYRREYLPVDLDGEQVVALTYVESLVERGLPVPAISRPILDGARHFALPVTTWIASSTLRSAVQRELDDRVAARRLDTSVRRGHLSDPPGSSERGRSGSVGDQPARRTRASPWSGSRTLPDRLSRRSPRGARHRSARRDRPT